MSGTNELRVVTIPYDHTIAERAGRELNNDEYRRLVVAKELGMLIPMSDEPLGVPEVPFSERIMDVFAKAAHQSG